MVHLKQIAIVCKNEKFINSISPYLSDSNAKVFRKYGGLVKSLQANTVKGVIIIDSLERNYCFAFIKSLIAKTIQKYNIKNQLNIEVPPIIGVSECINAKVLEDMCKLFIDNKIVTFINK